MSQHTLNDYRDLLAAAQERGDTDASLELLADMWEHLALMTDDLIMSGALPDKALPHFGGLSAQVARLAEQLKGERCG